MAADIALLLTPTGMNGIELDIAIVDGDIQTTEGLENGILISLFSDARAAAGQFWDNDPRGWWADAGTGDQTGSLIWLLNRAKLDNTYFQTAKKYAEDALAWMIADGVASTVTATFVQLDTELVGISLDIERPSGGPSTFKWFYNWQSQALMPPGVLNALD